MNVLQSYYAGVLAGLINGKKVGTAKADDIATVLKGMSFLAESSEIVDGSGAVETIAWIPLKYKRMLFYALYGSARNTRTVVEFRKGEWAKAVCTLSGTLDGVNYEYKAEATQAFTSTEPFGGLSDDVRNSRMIDYALAKAEKIALYNAGICMDFTGDIEEPSPTPGNDKLPEETVSEDVAKALNAALEAEKAGKTNLKDDGGVTDLSDVPTELKNAILENDRKLNENVDEDEEDLTIVNFGPQKEKPLAKMTPKYLAWMLNQLDCGKQSASEAYYETVKQLVMANELARTIYEKNSKKAS